MSIQVTVVFLLLIFVLNVVFATAAASTADTTAVSLRGPAKK